MPYTVILYPTPLEARVVVTPDGSGVGAVGVPYTHSDGRVGQACVVPDDTPDAHGAWIELTAPGYVPLTVHGFLQLDTATWTGRLEVDDFTLQEEITDDPDPIDPVDPSTRTPLEIIHDVYDRTDADLSTHDGCGQFTADVCDALHAEHSSKWGHIQKNPGQNQYQGHAVDAVMLLGDAKGVSNGIYDIIQDSVSAAAQPVFNYVEPADPNLWMYPAELAAVRYSYQRFALRQR
jgi:hypothetical protein